VKPNIIFQASNLEARLLAVPRALLLGRRPLFFVLQATSRRSNQ